MSRLKPSCGESSRLGANAFTLLELLVVMAVILIAAAFLLPALGPGAGRSADGGMREFMAYVENARLTALTERTKTRVLLPTGISSFSAAASPAPWPTNIPLHGYVTAIASRTSTLWTQRGKWNQLPDGVAFDSASSALVLPSPTPSPFAVDSKGTGAATFNFSGPYIEFLANGSSSLDPAASPTAVIVADGFVDSNGNFVAKNKGLRYQITFDPLSGSASVQ